VENLAEKPELLNTMPGGMKTNPSDKNAHLVTTCPHDPSKKIVDIVAARNPSAPRQISSGSVTEGPQEHSTPKKF